MKTTTIENDQNKSADPQDILCHISNNELLSFIENNLELKYRETYLRLKGGGKVSKSDLLKLQDHISHILQNNNINTDTL